MKPRTKQELAQLTKMNPGAFIEVKFDMEALEKACSDASESLLTLQRTINYIPKRKPLFERFYDYMSNLINGNKSIAPAELKSFR